MRCTACDYALWNLRTRTCPECGKPFAPSQFEFRPDSVKFCCPHCAQVYYGTAANGHLVPPAFTCVQCGNGVQMDEMILLPAAGTPEEQTLADTLPWTARRGRRIPAWFRTALIAMFQPVRLGRLLPAEGGLRGAATFSLIAQAIAPLFGIGGILLVIFLVTLFGPGPGPGRGGGLTAAGGLFVAMVAMVVSNYMFIGLWSVLAHALLRVTGPCRGHFAHTLSTLLYTSTACVIAGVPCLGLYLYPIALLWWGITASIMLAGVHRVPTWRAALAGGALPGLILGGALASVVYFAVVTVPAGLRAAQTAANQAVAQAAASSASGKTARMLTVLNERHALGEPFTHAVQLIIDADLVPVDFEVPEIPAAPGSGMIAGVLLTDIRDLNADAQEQLRERARALVHEPSGAHRLGHFVFVDRGVLDLGSDHANASSLWLVVCCAEQTDGTPDPDAASNPSSMAPARLPAGTWVVGLLDGTTRMLTPAATGAALAEQNRLRTRLGLPEIPDPATVRQNPLFDDEPKPGAPGS
ncbi:MAG: hypothetical protein AB7K52_00460 [Phycisphaerales bacterium]